MFFIVNFKDYTLHFCGFIAGLNASSLLAFSSPLVPAYDVITGVRLSKKSISLVQPLDNHIFKAPYSFQIPPTGREGKEEGVLLFQVS